jgi:hypothetical protein
MQIPGHEDLPGSAPDFSDIADEPVVFSYLVMPSLIKEARDLTFKPSRLPQMAYKELPWRHIADSFNYTLRVSGAPGGIHVSVANDALDVLDVLRCRSDGVIDKDYCPITAVSSAIRALEVSDFDGPMFDVRSSGEMTHINTSESRAPVGGVIIGVRFSSIFEAIQLSEILGELLMGLLKLNKYEADDSWGRMSGKMPSMFRDWLNSFGGENYGHSSAVVRLPTVAEGLRRS